MCVLRGEAVAVAAADTAAGQGTTTSLRGRMVMMMTGAFSRDTAPDYTIIIYYMRAARDGERWFVIVGFIYIAIFFSFYSSSIITVPTIVPILR